MSNNVDLLDTYKKRAEHILNDVKAFFKEMLSLETNNYVNSFTTNRSNQIKALFGNILQLLELYFKLIVKFKNSTSNENFRFYIDLIIKNCIAKIKRYLEEPLSYFPDASLWLLFNDQPIGVCTIKSEDIIWSPDPNKRGIISTRMIYTDVKSLKPSDFNNPERENIARIRICMSLVYTNDLEIQRQIEFSLNLPPWITSNG